MIWIRNSGVLDQDTGPEKKNHPNLREDYFFFVKKCHIAVVCYIIFEYLQPRINFGRTEKNTDSVRF